ncbi:ribbon-helix-helix protein, CopG family [Mesorhizobium onobrychidis]|uniref:Ribbon-helix-helix protein, CopG family n=1 Tax=Mesorhizobium onobrychidis TaxID=2775404 RepID=A0ABY5R0S1_9HYPH|nr:ribbon-helix-helix protein, CopG family [Mesorhizobium onobrychidis]UVC17080.1 ribbon-helix-helix protein, CopG family [Mesorhizobium onobrychidis]
MYYKVYPLFTNGAYALDMSKKVISFRLAEDDLAILDKTARRFNMSRSEALIAALRSFNNDYVNENGTFVRRTPWWLQTLGDETK